MLQFQLKRPPLRLFLLAGVAILVLIVQIAGLFPGVTTPLERVEFSVRDLMMRLRGVQPNNGNIVIVAIDDFSFNWTNYQWPWPRAYLAKIVDQLNRGGAKVVGLDVFLFEPGADSGGDEALAKSLSESNAAVSVLQIFESSPNSFTLHQPLPIYRSALGGLGITSFTRDDDAVVRSVRAFDSYAGADYFHWAFQLARLYLNIEPASAPSAAGLRFNRREVPLDNGQLLVNFNGPAGTYPTYHAADVADGITLEADPNAFRNKIVLIGATTVTLQDVYPTPFSGQTLMPGVEVVANAVDTLITGHFLREPLPWVALIFTLVAALLAWAITRLERPTRILILLGTLMLVYLGLCYIAFTQTGWLLPVAAPEIMIFLGVILPTLEQAVSQELEKRRVRNLFTRFIAPEMVDQMIATQDINSLNKRAELTVLFSDIRGFTTMSEKLPPDQLVALLNSYLEAMTAIIHKYGGTVDKYEGDAIVAFFGEPVQYADHARRAVAASVEMLAQLPSLTEKWIREGRPIQHFDIGVGLNSGDVFVGLVGSAQRINYTVIGDNANLASRLQDLTKTYQWPILISESTYQQVRDEFETEWVDSVIVKGKTEPVNVYKVIGNESRRVQPWQ